MKKLLKKLIILLLVITIVLIISIIVLQKRDGSNNTIKYDNNINTDIDKDNEIKDDNIPILSISKDMLKEKTESTFYSLKQNINKYYNAIEKKDANQLYNLLSERYIKDNNVNISNSINIVGQLKNGFQDFRIRKIYYRHIDNDGKVEYYVLGDILGEGYRGLEITYLIVNVDGKKGTFSITPTNINIENDTQYLQQFAEIEIYNNSEILKNQYNTYNSKSLETTDIIQYYLKDYTTMALYYPEIAYNLLNEEYRNKRFGSIEEYKNHIKQNEMKLTDTIPIKYGFDKKGNNKQYTIIDDNNNTYVIEISDVMEYTVISDIYTVNIDSIIEKYDNGSDEDKVKINIQKIMEALNNKDYKYVYSKLSEDFKINRYPTIDNLKNEISIYGSSYVVFGDYIEDEDNYIYNIEVKGNSVSSSKFKMKIIMKLKDDRDYSFEFEQIQYQANS